MHYVETLLMNALKTDRGVHVETLLTAVGALAGFAAQHAIRESIVRPGRLPLQGGKNPTEGAFVVAEGRIPRLPDNHRPQLTPREALNKLWPTTKQALQFRDPKLVGAEGELDPRPAEDWPMIIGIVAQRLIDKTKAALDPRLGMRIVFESAVPMSKVDPRGVPH